MIQKFSLIFDNVVENYENIYSNNQNLETKGENRADILAECRGDHPSPLQDGL